MALWLQMAPILHPLSWNFISNPKGPRLDKNWKKITVFLRDNIHHHNHHRSAAEQATTSFLQPQRSCANSDSLPGPIMLSVSPKEIILKWPKCLKRSLFTQEKRRKLGLVNFRENFWDRYWRCACQLLANFFPVSRSSRPFLMWWIEKWMWFASPSHPSSFPQYYSHGHKTCSVCSTQKMSTLNFFTWRNDVIWRS